MTEDINWKVNIEQAYTSWKRNDINNNVKASFDGIKDIADCPLNGPSLNVKRDIEELRLCDENEDSDADFAVDEEHVEYLGSKVLVGPAVDTEEVNSFCLSVIWNGFWKTARKLLDEAYLALKSIGECVKKLLKKVCTFLEAGFKKVVVKLGHLIAKLISFLHPIPDYGSLRLDDGTQVLSVRNHEFVNYGETVRNTPSHTLFPKTVDEVRSVVRHAVQNGFSVRVAGMKHSWSDLFSEDGQILLSFLPLEVTDTLTYGRLEKPIPDVLRDWDSSLNFIEFERELPEEMGERKAAVRIGAATTNLEILRWSLDMHRGGSEAWTLPLNIIAVMITNGGSNATICHGAGFRHKTLSDLVLRIEFVNANGNLQVVDEESELKAAAGAFGLLGVVTAVTLKMDIMTHVGWHPKKSNMVEVIPLPENDSNETLGDLCENSYYAEFFWFPNHGTDEGFWQNCWENDEDPPEEFRFLNEKLEYQFQVASTFLFDVISTVLVPLTVIENRFYSETFGKLLRYLYTKITSKAGVDALPEPEQPITTTLVEALHFRRGFHYIAVREMECEIPIPPAEDGNPDWSIVQKAWWDGVRLIQESAGMEKYAVDMTLEMRIMGGSDILMAPQYGNLGTIAIEPVSTRIVPKKIWEEFKVTLASRWCSYTDYKGNPLKTRIHWAKESPSKIHFDGQDHDIFQYNNIMYSKEMRQFTEILKLIANNGNYDFYKMINTFSNAYLRTVFAEVWKDEGIAQTVPKRSSRTSEETEDGSSCTCKLL